MTPALLTARAVDGGGERLVVTMRGRIRPTPAGKHVRLKTACGNAHRSCAGRSRSPEASTYLTTRLYGSGCLGQGANSSGRSAMIILNVGYFYTRQRHKIHTLTNFCRRVSLGLHQNGHFVVEFSDRDLVHYYGFYGAFRGLGRKGMCKKLLETIGQTQPEQIWIGMGYSIGPDILAKIRKARPDIPVVLYNTDVREKPFPHLVDMAPNLDWIFLTAGGEALRWYSKAGCPNVAFVPNMTDPAIDRTYPCDPAWQSRALFTGGLHGDPERRELIEYLAANIGVQLYGCLGRPSVTGLDYFRAISNTKIGIDIGAQAQFSKYFSDRAVHYLGCGMLVLTRAVPDIDKMFDVGGELVCFASKEECLDKLRYFQDHEDERRAIALAGQKAVRERFSMKAVVGDMLDTIAGNHPGKPWTEIVHG